MTALIINSTDLGYKLMARIIDTPVLLTEKCCIKHMFGTPLLEENKKGGKKAHLT